MPLIPKRQRPGRKGDRLWLIIFSDMSTNLMLFFLMMFAMTRMSQAERDLMTEGLESAVNTQAIEDRQRLEREEDRAIRVLNDTIVYGRLKQYTHMEVTEKDIKLTLELPVFFGVGSAELMPEAKDALGSLVGPLGAFQNGIVIEGHTDDQPIHGGRYPSNWELSVARAVSVIGFFKERGLSEAVFVSGGYGEYHPVADNGTEEGRARNRRIEITIRRTGQP